MRFTTIRDIEWWADQVTTGCDAPKTFEGPRFLRPVHFAVLAGHLHRRGMNVRVPPALEVYSARMHLWQAIGRAPQREVAERAPEGRFHPLTPVRTENDAADVADAISLVFRASGTRSARTLTSISNVLTEIAGNCVHHASNEPGIKGLVCAQAWPKGKLAQVVIADTGVGIRASLDRNPIHRERLAKTNAAKLATLYGVTGNPEGHSGYGLTLARDLMQMHGGNFVVVSGQEAFRALQGRTESKRLQRGWDGTIVVLEWKTDRALNTLSVYRSWPDSEPPLP